MNDILDMVMAVDEGRKWLSQAHRIAENLWADSDESWEDMEEVMSNLDTIFLNILALFPTGVRQAIKDAELEQVRISDLADANSY